MAWQDTKATNGTLTAAEYNSLVNWVVSNSQPTASIDHDQLKNFASNEHFTEASIDHTNIQNIGSYTHSQIDSYIDTHPSVATADIDHDTLKNTHNLTTDIDHNSITNNHNLTTDIDHNAITNNHNLTTDIDHNSITNNHNLTTDIDHTNITNKGTNTHAQIDTHLGLTNQHIDWTNANNQFKLNYSSAGNSMWLSPSNDAGDSQSSGGAVRITNTGNIGSALVIYSNAGTSADGHLMQIGADNEMFTKDNLRLWSDGDNKLLEAVSNHSATSVTEIISMTGISPNATTLGVNGGPDTKGVVKIKHTGAVSDGNSSGLSIDLNGAGTAAQGIFVDATNGGTTGDLMKLRNNSVLKFQVDKDGDVVANSFTGDGSGLTGLPSSTPTDEIDHDSLKNYVANEHIDWTQDQGGTNIHSGNYTAGGSSVTDYGGIYINVGTRVLTTEDVWYAVDVTTAWTEGAMSECTFSDPYITIENTGTYLINWVFKGTLNASNNYLHIGIMVDGNSTDEPAHGEPGVQNEGRNKIKISSGGVNYDLNSCAILELDAGRTVSLAAMNSTSSGKTLTVTISNMTIVRIA